MEKSIERSPSEKTTTSKPRSKTSTSPSRTVKSKVQASGNSVSKEGIASNKTHSASASSSSPEETSLPEIATVKGSGPKKQSGVKTTKSESLANKAKIEITNKKKEVSKASKPSKLEVEYNQPMTSPLDQLYSSLTLQKKVKMALVVMDGVGDIATKENNYLTPLEAAVTPNLDALSRDSAQGRLIPVAHGITPGSGPGHLALFGYDPIEYQVGRGVIETLGLGIELQPGDIAARANFCTLDDQDIVTDRRAGRIPTETCEAMCKILSSKIKKIRSTEVIIQPGKGHRFVVVFRDKKLPMEGPLTDADPNREGYPIPTVEPVDANSKAASNAAKVIQEFYKQALPLLKDQKPANGFLMRGISHKPNIPTFEERYNMKAACIAVYPMYKGLSQLVGMDKLEGAQSIQEEFQIFQDNYDKYDFFFIHFKTTDMMGEDGDFEGKKKAIEEFDAALPNLLQKKLDVIAITGDHSTPCPVAGHSWHPQPALLHSKYSGWDKLERFTETGANLGSLGIIEAKYLMRLMQANGGMFDKFGA